MTCPQAEFGWFDEPLTISVMVGELSLWQSHALGIRCHPDIFDTPPLASLQNVLDDVRRQQSGLAFLYSCPVTPDCGSLASARGYVAFVDDIYSHYYVETRANFQQYLELRNKKTVSTLKRKVRKVEATNGSAPIMREYASSQEMDTFFEVALPVSQKSYQHRLIGQGLPANSAFRTKVKAKAGNGEMLAYTLHVAGQAVAYNLCPVYSGTRVLYDYTGFDPHFAQYSPGAVLQFKIIENLFGRSGLDYYDLCTGEGAHKELFATGSIRCANIYVFRWFSRHLPLFLVRWMVRRVVVVLTRLLELIGVKAALKKLIRGYA